MAPRSLHRHSTGLCVRFPLILMAPIDPRTAHAHPHLTPIGGPCLPPHIMHGEIKASLDVRSCRPKVSAEEEKRQNGGSLSCGALPLKASWPAICAGSQAIATTPGRERRERQPEKEGGRDGETDWEHER